MPLSEYEQRVLEQMERQLRSDDPKLAHTFNRRPRRAGRVLGGSGLVVAGLIALVGGVASGMIWLGAIGFLAMFGGVLLALSTPRGSSAAASSGSSGPVRGTQGGAQKRSGGSRMQRLEERWERRRREQGR